LLSFASKVVSGYVLFLSEGVDQLMSHIVEAKTKITCPHLQAFLSLSRQGSASAVAALPLIALLRQAVTLVAREQGGTVASYYLDYDRERHEVNTGLALHIPRRAGRPGSQALERGMGLSIDERTGVLTFVGDPYRVEEFSQAMQRRIVQTYTALAYAAAMRLEQYQQVTVRAEQERVVVSGAYHA
jgi:hypothetical protein